MNPLGVFRSPSDGWVDSALPLDDVLARIDARAREWRESTLPRALRSIGVYGIRVRRNGPVFTFQSQGGGRRMYIPVLVGRVSARSDGGSRVDVRYRPSAGTTIALVFACAWMVGATLLGGGGTFADAAVTLIIVLLVAGLVYSASRKTIIAEQSGLESVLRETIEARD